MTGPVEPTPDRLLEVLHRDFGDALRSCVEYTPTSERIHYLREDIDRDAADGRVVRIKQLYQAERLNASPLASDPGLDRLHVSIHVFDRATVVHLLDHGGAVIGFSVEHEALPLGSVHPYLEAAFGTVPDSLADLG